jgi:hypothetical protein
MELTVAVLVTIVVLPMIFIKVRDLFTRGGAVVDLRDGKVRITPARSIDPAGTIVIAKPDGTIQQIPQTDDTEHPPSSSGAAPPALLEKLVDRFNTRVAVQVLITLVGLVGAGYIILSGNYSGGIETTSGGIVGIVFGYWLK